MKVSIVRPLALAGSLACMAAFVAVPATAQDGGNVDQQYQQRSEQSQQSSITRAQVTAEYLQAVKDGAVPVSSENAGFFGGAESSKAANASSLTRQAVIADTIEWMKLHQSDVQMGGQ